MGFNKILGTRLRIDKGMHCSYRKLNQLQTERMYYPIADSTQKNRFDEP